MTVLQKIGSIIDNHVLLSSSEECPWAQGVYFLMLAVSVRHYNPLQSTVPVYLSRKNK